MKQPEPARPNSPRPRRPTIAAVRGAISVRANAAEDIRETTARLLYELMRVNGIAPEQIVSAVFTSTPDLDADFPAHAARRLGWRDVPLLGAQEVAVPGAPARIVRVLLTVAAPARKRLRPVYLGEAARLRPDLAPVKVRPHRALLRRVAIVGVGQIGGSIGLALGVKGGWWRVGYDLDRTVLESAHAAGALDEVAPSLEAACAGAELAVLAAPIDALPALADRAAAALPPGAALLDTAGARGPVTPALIRAVARGVRAVGGHPIAGAEGRGFAAARPELFEGAPFALLPPARTSGRRRLPEVVSALVRDLGARPVVVEPEDHDAALARTSHLPYLVACALREAGADAARRDLCGPTYHGMTRVAASDPRVARGVCRANAAAVRAAWAALRARLDQEVAALEVVGGAGGAVE